MEGATNNLPNISKDTTVDKNMDNNMDTTMGDSEIISNIIDGMGKVGSDSPSPLFGVSLAGCGVGKSQLINTMTTNLEPKSPNVTAPPTSPSSEKKTSPLANSISKTSKPIGIIKKTRSLTHSTSASLILYHFTPITLPLPHFHAVLTRHPPSDIGSASPITKPTTKSGAHSAPTVSNTSPFMRLPANLRNKILLEALEPATTTTAIATTAASTSNTFADDSTSRSSGNIATITSLLSLNRQIRTEIQTLMIAKAKTTSKHKNTNEDDEVNVQTKEDGNGKAKKEMEEMTNILKEKLDLHAEMGGDNTEFEGLVAEAMKE
ncbi:MAG: Aldo/keto reductase [Aureobasidium pullulans]|nr:MAG: Uncharacterized protein AUREO_045210 [Aureobasidium pullulans]OBW66672.1 MAG: Aldo/keto reductase [Aureobasidium pullulans]